MSWQLLILTVVFLTYILVGLGWLINNIVLQLWPDWHRRNICDFAPEEARSTF